MFSLWFVRCVAPVSPSCLTCPLILYLLMSTCVAAVALQFSLKLAYSFQPRGIFGIAAAQRFWLNSSISKKKNTKIYIWCMLQCFKAFFCYLFINRYLSLLHMSGLCMHLHAWLSIFHRGMWLLSLMWKIRKKKMQGANHLWRGVEVVLVVFAIETFATYWKDSEKNYVLSIYLSNYWMYLTEIQFIISVCFRINLNFLFIWWETSKTISTRAVLQERLCEVTWVVAQQKLVKKIRGFAHSWKTLW